MLHALALSLALVRPGAPRTGAAPVVARDTAVFAGGCFWGVQAVFKRVKGVVQATSGYAGGTSDHPSYQQVSTGTTGYAESVQVIFDPAMVSYQQLLEVFFTVAHDPTELNRQGPDEGTQYRSAVFYRSADQERQAQQWIAHATATHQFRQPIVTQLSALGQFHPAEAYHQDFYDHNPDNAYIVINDRPKVTALKAKFPGLYTGK